MWACQRPAAGSGYTARQPNHSVRTGTSGSQMNQPFVQLHCNSALFILQNRLKVGSCPAHPGAHT